MVEIASALAGVLKPGRHGPPAKTAGLTLSEVKGRDVVQVGAWRETVDRVREKLAYDLGTLPATGTRAAVTAGERTVIPVGPDKFLVVAPASDNLFQKLSAAFPASEAVVTELGHSRAILRIAGPNARDLVARYLAVDLDPSVFPVGSFAASGLHGVGVLLHYVRDMGGSSVFEAPVFDLYLPRSFAASLTEGILHVAEQWPCQVEA